MSSSGNAPGAQHRPPGKGKRNKNLFKLREFEVHQEHCGMKVGTDALLLGTSILHHSTGDMPLHGGPKHD